MFAEMLRSSNAIWVERDDTAGTLHVPLELFVLAFAQATRAEEALRALNELRRDTEVQIEDVAVLTRDACGAGGFADADDFLRRPTLSEGVKSAMMRLLPAPLCVLTGRSARTSLDAVSPEDRAFQAWDPHVLPRYLAVDSSALVLLIERQWVDDLIEMISRIAIARRCPRLQVTLDDTIDRFLAPED